MGEMGWVREGASGRGGRVDNFPSGKIRLGLLRRRRL